MEGYQVSYDHIKITDAQSGIISLKEYGYVIGWSIEITDQSTDPILYYGYNDRKKVRINQGDAARQYGGDNVCGIPCYHDGTIQYDFSTAAGPWDGLVIISLLRPISKTLE